MKGAKFTLARTAVKYFSRVHNAQAIKKNG